MKETLNIFFKNEGIEYFAALSYGDLAVTNKKIADRLDFSPRSAIVFLIPYYTGTAVNLSEYAVAKDYHIYVKEITGKLTEVLRKDYPNYSYVGFGDHSPINERAAAAAGGLGVIGDNGLLINERYGSYVFIAELLTDAPPELVGAVLPRPIMHCEGCGACRLACPSGRLSDPLSPCLSAVTQKKGDLTDDEVRLVRASSTVWGCDACQSACPHNLTPVKTPIDFFKNGLTPALTDKVLLEMSDCDFSERAYSWRGRKTVQRNLEILSQNSIKPD